MRLNFVDAESVNELHSQNGFGGKVQKDLGDIERRILSKQTAELIHRPAFPCKIQFTSNRPCEMIDQSDRIEDPSLCNVSLNQQCDLLHQ